VEGVLVASRRSVSKDPVGRVRGMSRCRTLGEAAGVAADRGAQPNTPAEQVPIRDIKKQLIAQGAYLGEEDRFRR